MFSGRSVFNYPCEVKYMMEKKPLDMLAWILVIIGGLNWGLIGVLNLNIVDMIFSSVPILAQIVYILVGLSALYMIYVGFMKK